MMFHHGNGPGGFDVHGFGPTWFGGWGMGPGFFGGWGGPGCWGPGGMGYGGLVSIAPDGFGGFLAYPYSPGAELLSIPILAIAVVGLGAFAIALLKMLGAALLVPIICALLAVCLLILLPNAVRPITAMLLLQPFISYAWCSLCWAMWAVGERKGLLHIGGLGWLLIAIAGLVLALYIGEESFGLGFLHLFSGIFLWWSGILGADSFWRGELMVRYWFRIFGVIAAIALAVNLIQVLRSSFKTNKTTGTAARSTQVSGPRDVLTGLALGVLAMLSTFLFARLFIDTQIAHALLLLAAVLLFGGAAWLYASPKRAAGGLIFLFLPLLFGLAAWYAGEIDLSLVAAPLRAADKVQGFLTADVFSPLAEAAAGLGEALAGTLAALLHLLLDLIMMIFDSSAPTFTIPAEAGGIAAIPLLLLGVNLALKIKAGSAPKR